MHARPSPICEFSRRARSTSGDVTVSTSRADGRSAMAMNSVIDSMSPAASMSLATSICAARDRGWIASRGTIAVVWPRRSLPFHVTSSGALPGTRTMARRLTRAPLVLSS